MRLKHIGLFIKNLEQARKFYGNILGFREMPRPPFLIKGIWYDLGDFELHLMLHETASFPSVHPLNSTVQPHFAIELPQIEISKIVERLKNADIKLLKEPEFSPGGVWQIFFYDFDKNMIEINQSSDEG